MQYIEWPFGMVEDKYMKNTLLKNILAFVISITVLASVIVIGLIYSEEITYFDVNNSISNCLGETPEAPQISFTEDLVYERSECFLNYSVFDNVV